MNLKIYTSKSEAFSLSEGNVIQLDSMTYTLIANDGTTIYPSDLHLNGGVEIFNSSNELVYTYTFQFTRANLYGSYKATAVASYRVPTVDKYTFRIYITTPSSWASSYTVSGTATARKQTGNNVQTYIGANGAFFHNSPNKMIYNSNEALRLQYGMNGIAWVNDEYTGNKSMQVIAGFRSEGDGTYTPLFLPFYNYTPITSDFSFVYQNVTNIGSSRYAHVIQPFTDRGYLLVDNAAMDGNGNKQETWFILPSSQLYDNRFGGTYFNLPIGYTVKIINNLQGLANLYVTPYSTGKDLAKIYTAENTKASYMKLSGDNSMKTFMYVGGHGTESGMAWRVID